MYPDLKSARLGLLGESCEIANRVGLEYAVCGGWSPFLRNSAPIQHPGTKDVDLLFADGVKVNALSDVVEAFIDKGFYQSTKHEFQLIRILEVGGHRLAFNVDLLHPAESNVRNGMFVEHLELPVLEDVNAIARLKAKSIAAPHSQFVFTGFVEWERINYLSPDQISTETNVPLIDEVGVLVTKSKSCLGPKRPRDLFDIFLAITQPRNEAIMKQRLQLLHDQFPAAFELIAEIKGAYREPNRLSSEARATFEVAGVTPDAAMARIDSFLQGYDL